MPAAGENDRSDPPSFVQANRYSYPSRYESSCTRDLTEVPAGKVVPCEVRVELSVLLPSRCTQAPSAYSPCARQCRSKEASGLTKSSMPSSSKVGRLLLVVPG